MQSLHSEYAIMKVLTIRNVSRRLADALDRERRRRDTSLNQTVLDLLGRQLGIDDGPRSNGLARFAGTWSDEDLSAFEDAVRPLDTVDEEMWR